MTPFHPRLILRHVYVRGDVRFSELDGGWYGTRRSGGSGYFLEQTQVVLTSDTGVSDPTPHVSRPLRLVSDGDSRSCATPNKRVSDPCVKEPRTGSPTPKSVFILCLRHVFLEGRIAPSLQVRVNVSLTCHWVSVVTLVLRPSLKTGEEAAQGS